MIDVYVSSLILLILSLALATYWKSNQDKEQSVLFDSTEEHRLQVLEDEIHDPDRDTSLDRYHSFRLRFLVVYGLAIAADWLQASFMYDLYKHKYKLSENTIASLFATGFLCGGVSATFVVVLADKYGRRLASLSYCCLYSLSCLAVLSRNVSILFLGRVLGGVSTTLLSTVFEAWMIAEYNRLGPGYSETALSSVYGAMSILNGVVAVASGVVSQYLVYVTGSEVAPFMASVVCLGITSFLVCRSWSENFGTERRVINAAWYARSTTHPDRRTFLSLGLAVCCAEGSMYIMVYFWSQALTSARDRAFEWAKGKPPFGLAFASFMCALTLGSFFFTYLTRNGNSTRLSSSAVQVAMASASACLLLSVWAEAEAHRFWAFCIFEFFLGIYFPSMSFLKGILISDAQRAWVYGLLRVPLNTFVVLALGTIEEGDTSREDRFMICAGMLLISVASIATYVPK